MSERLKGHRDVMFVGKKSKYFRSAITHQWSIDDLLHRSAITQQWSLDDLFIDQPSLNNDHSMMSPLNVVRDLGVQFRADLSVADLVSKVVHSCCYNIRQLRTMRSSLTRDHLRDAAYALILSRLDYCNALYLIVSVSYTDSKC